jgi:hypothetical protein
MIDHNLTQFGLDENLLGEANLPSEKGAINVSLNLRQFIILARRAYSALALDALSDSEGIKVRSADDADYNASPFFHIRLTVKSKNDLQEFAANEGEAFFERVLGLYSHSDIAGNRGQRLAFVGPFQVEDDAQKGEVLVSDALIGTSVFYNDYRVTVGYPSNDDDYLAVVGQIYHTLVAQYPDLEIEVTFNPVEATADDLFD